MAIRKTTDERSDAADLVRKPAAQHAGQASGERGKDGERSGLHFGDVELAVVEGRQESGKPEKPPKVMM